MAQRRILIVEDEATIRRTVADALTIAGYSVTIAEDGEEGLRLFNQTNPHLVIADIMLPRLDGFEMVKRMRRVGGTTQYLFLSARCDADDVVEGFRVGGNDYIRKPFAIQELIARAEALLSRNEEQSATTFAIGHYHFDSVAQHLSLDNNTRHLSARENALLHALASNLNRVVNSNQLLTDIWGNDSYYNLRSMNVYISKLRLYLADDQRIEISSVRGVGYCLRINTHL